MRIGRVARSLMAGCAALLVVLASSLTAAGFTGVDFPTQSIGNRGTNVRVIQHLLRARGESVAVTGYYGSITAGSVRAFQSRVGLTANGVTNAATWRRLVTTVRRGSTGEAVRAVQLLLREKRSASFSITGTYGDQTHNGVLAFERHAGLAADGVVDATAWRDLVWHYERPAFELAALCDYGSGTTADWGTSAAIGQLESGAGTFYAQGHGAVAVGDVSYEHGGKMSGHETHRRGLDVDLRPMRDDEQQCAVGTNWRSTAYDRTATRALIKAIRAAAAGHVKLIYFNDPTLVREGLTTTYAGHDDHLHIRYCEVVHVDSAYRC